MDQPTARKRVTLKDVARAADVSLGSASYAINGNGSVDERTRARIIEAAKKLGYRQNLSAQAMRTGKTRALGLVLPDFTNQFFPALAQFVMRAARQHGYSVFITDTEGSEELEAEALNLLAERGVEGIVWFPVRDTGAPSGPVAETPTVVLDRRISGMETIQADYHGGGRLAAEHLLGLGHTRIGLVTGPQDVASVRERVRGATEAIAAAGHSPAFVVENAFSTDIDAAAIAALQRREATAIICGADLIALGVIRAAGDQGVKVPEDLSVIGFDDIPWAQFSSPPLTTIEMPIEEMAAEAIDRLMKRIDGHKLSHRQVTFGTSLVERGSTAAPKIRW